jgi:hypothetical protein
MKNHDPSTFENTTPESMPEEPFLRRWSKRKLDTASATQQSADVATASMPAPVQLPSDVRTENREPAQSPRELTDEDMPPLDSLDEDSDYSGFFSPKVSEPLRRLALRKLFHFQQFNITDGLNDYDGDYTNFEKLGGIVTHEMKRLLEREAKLIQEKAATTNGGPDTREPPANQGDENVQLAMTPEAVAETPEFDVEAEQGLLDRKSVDT